MKKKTALVTGITGQDGSYLSELLLEKGYTVFGLHRRSSTPNTGRIDHLFDTKKYPNFHTIYGDLSDSTSIQRIIEKVQPDEIYNLGAQSDVGVSFHIPEYTANITGLAAVRILDAIRAQKKKIKYYQASSSEMFGKVLETPQKETTPFNPQSPYGASKTFAFFTTKLYRTGYKLFASNGILFNHESPRRGEKFVTRKITLALSKLKLGIGQPLMIGNLDAKRDWGYAKDYVEAIWAILQHKEADDFLIATGETHSVREFIEQAAKHLDYNIEWKGKGVQERGVDKNTGKILVKVDRTFFRPNEVDLLIGDSSKAKKLLKWKPKVTFEALAELMIKHDFDALKEKIT